MRPMVSTLTSCYRGEKYLPLFLEKLPEQTAFDRLEVVIDLNEPSAEELRLVKEFQERHPGHLKYAVQDKVVPYSASWNNCIRNASGEYLAIWNIDDLRTPNSIESQARLLDERPDIGIVHGRYKVVPSFGSTDGPYRDTTKLPKSEATRRFVFGPFYMFRRSLLEKAGIVDEQFRSSADLDHCIRMALHSDFAAVDENLGYYLWAGEGLSNNPNSRIEVENFVIRMRYGIYDKLWYYHLAAASQYDLYKVLNGSEWVPITRYVPQHRKMLEERYSKWFDIGLLRHLAFKAKKENWTGIKGVCRGFMGK